MNLHSRIRNTSLSSAFYYPSNLDDNTTCTAECTLSSYIALLPPPFDLLLYFKYEVLLFILHNSYGTPEFPDSGNLLGADWVENLKWDHTEPHVPFGWVHTELSMHFRKGNTEPSMHFREANTEPSMHFRRDITEFLYLKILGKNFH